MKYNDAPFSPSTVGKHLLVAYWGQNSAGIKNPENPEKTLKDVCEMKYDIIVIGFVVTFFGANNKGEVRTARHDHFAVNITTYSPPFRRECNRLSNVTEAPENCC